MNELLSDNLGNQHDEFYAALMQAHEGLTFAQSARLNAKLVLLMANRIGDVPVLQELVSLAKQGLDASPGPNI
jgi:hypothetical protein